MSQGSDGRRPLRLLLPAPVRRLPGDVAASLALAVVAVVVVVVPPLATTSLRVAVGVPLTLFVPGYLLVSALFPEAAGLPDAEAETDDGSGLSHLARIGLAFPASVLVTVVVTLVTIVSPLPFTPSVLATFLAMVVAALGVTTARRRARLPSAERYAVPEVASLAGLRDHVRGESTGQTAMKIVLLASVALAISALIFALAAPPGGQPYTELAVTNPDGYEQHFPDTPLNVAPGETRPLRMTVHNAEHETVRYTLMVNVQRVTRWNGSVVVQESTLVARHRPLMSDGETWNATDSVVMPSETGEYRLVYLLFRGSPPPDPSLDNAYRSARLWVNVTSDR